MCFVVRSYLAVLGSLLCSLSVLGCGSSDPIVIVRGKVTVGGVPAKHALVYFNPVSVSGESESGPRSIGVVDETGEYRLYLSVGSLREGAVIGPHLVNIFGAESMDQFRARFGEKPPKDKMPEVKVPAPYSKEGGEFVVPDHQVLNADFNL